MKFMISFLAVILVPVTDIQAETLSVDEYAKAEKYIVESDTERLKSAKQLSRMVANSRQDGRWLRPFKLRPNAAVSAPNE
jgi:hypothetical protein